MTRTPVRPDEFLRDALDQLAHLQRYIERAGYTLSDVSFVEAQEAEPAANPAGSVERSAIRAKYTVVTKTRPPTTIVTFVFISDLLVVGYDALCGREG